MASSVAPAVCSNAPYAEYLPLAGFAPAVTFCSAYQAASTLPPIPACPEGDALCSMLSSLSKCDRALISTAWYVNLAFSVDVTLTHAIVLALKWDQR